MSFSDLPLILGEALSERGYAAPTPVQAAVLEAQAQGRDLIVSAQTGSGKTVAFGLAMAGDLLGPDGRVPPPAAPLALVIAPTRELALQVSRELIWLYGKAGARIATCVGGMDASRERRALAQLMEENPFRVPYYAASVPITKGDELQGCVTAIYPPHMAPTAQRPFLIGRAEDRWIPVPLHEIAAIESHYGKTWLHTMGRGTLRNKYNLTQLERMLPPDRFIRCHRAYIVNVEAIDEIHPDFHSTFLLVMKGTSLRVPVSQKYASRFRAYLGI